ncbi:MAG: fumarylacetoacetate hydrolase family protein [Myxococcales bacterium]
MKLCRFEHAGAVQYGILEGDAVEVLSAPPFERIEKAGRRVPLADVRLLTPTDPGKIVGVGLNYRAHAEEMKKPVPEQPLLFLKPPTAALDPERPIVLPRISGEVHYEAELAVVIGRRCRRVSPEEAREAILGYTCFVDVTARDIQRREIQYTRAKGCDTFAPFGPVIATGLDPRNLQVTGRVNGAVRQNGRTSDMIFDVYSLVSFVSQGMTLLPGDVLTTGTPPGVGPLAPGDLLEIEIEGVGVLRNPIVAEE